MSLTIITNNGEALFDFEEYENSDPESSSIRSVHNERSSDEQSDDIATELILTEGLADSDSEWGIEAAERGTRTQREFELTKLNVCLLYTSPSPRDLSTSRMPSSA